MAFTMYNINDKQKWTNEAISTLIEAYKEEPCLYAVNTPNYHNKHMRSNALRKVCATVSLLRPGTTENECSIKFHNLRNQFNIANAKVKASIKSGTGTDDIYTPTLWYFNDLKYLESYFTPRKSRNSIEKMCTDNSWNATEVDVSSETQQFPKIHFDEEYLEEEWLDIHGMNTSTAKSTTGSISQLTEPSQTVVELTTEKSSIKKPHAVKSVTQDRTSFYSNNSLCSSPAVSPANSTTSSEISTRQFTKSTKKRKSNNENTYTDAIETIADTLKQPVVVKSLDTTAKNLLYNTLDPVDACMAFIGSILKRIKNEVLQMDIMHVLVQTVINASTQNIEKTSHT